MTNQYVCGFCKTSHDNLADYARCVSSCNAKELEKKKSEERAKLRAERDAANSKKNEAHKARLSRMRDLESELERLKTEEYKEYPTYREESIENIADLLRNILPEITRLRGNFYGV